MPIEKLSKANFTLYGLCLRFISGTQASLKRLGEKTEASIFQSFHYSTNRCILEKRKINHYSSVKRPSRMIIYQSGSYPSILQSSNQTSHVQIYWYHQYRRVTVSFQRINWMKDPIIDWRLSYSLAEIYTVKFIYRTWIANNFFFRAHFFVCTTNRDLGPLNPSNASPVYLPYPNFGIIVPALICNLMPSTVWGEIFCPFPNFNGCTVEIWNG